MKKLLISLSCLLLAASARSQELSLIPFQRGSTPVYYAFRTDQDIIIRISENGQLLKWGTGWNYYRYNYTDTLVPYTGRVDYYGQEYDSVSRGKVKSIGTCSITYYGAFELPGKAGKIKSIGRTRMDYYDDFENQSLRGKIKSAGSLYFTYYASYENEAFRGKLKMVGTSTITYYSSFDDKNIQGKVKSIGPFNYTWYTQNDSRGYPGTLKSGEYKQNVAGVIYLILN
ncbi:MAG: hypothetical protein ABL876_07880 [Chitinophagaceae bacterium]